MGLDAVEIVLAVEEKFGIAIPDEVAEKIATPGEMTDYVFHKIQHPDASSCLSQRAFHLLRRAWMVNLQTPRNLFCLDTGVDHIVPRENRRHLWADLGRQVGAVSWPALQRSEVLVAGLCIVTIATFVAMYLLGAHALGWGSGLPVLVAVGSCALLGWGVTVATRPLKTAIPSRFRDIRDLVEYMVARNPQIAKTDEKKCQDCLLDS